MMSNRTYDILKWIAQLLLPALGIGAYIGSIMQILLDRHNRREDQN